MNLQGGKSVSPMSSFTQKILIIEFQLLPFPFPTLSKSPAPLSTHEGCKPTPCRPPSGYTNCDICHSLHQGTFHLLLCYCVANLQPHPESSRLYRELAPAVYSTGVSKATAVHRRLPCIDALIGENGGKGAVR